MQQAALPDIVVFKGDFAVSQPIGQNFKATLPRRFAVSCGIYGIKNFDVSETCDNSAPQFICGHHQIW